MKRFDDSLDCPRLTIKAIIPVDASLRHLDGGVMFFLHEHGITLDGLLMDVFNCCIRTTAAPLTRESVSFCLPMDDVIETLEYNNIAHDPETVSMVYLDAVYKLYTCLYPWFMTLLIDRGLRDLRNPCISTIRFDKQRYVLNSDELYIEMELEEEL